MMSMWNEIVTVRRAAPDSTNLRRYAWSAICVLAGLLYLVVYTRGYLTGVVAGNAITIGVYTLRAILIITLAVWAARSLSWRETNLTEQRHLYPSNRSDLRATFYSNMP